MDPASSPNSNRMMSQQHIEIRHSPRVAGTFSDSDFPMVLVAPSARGPRGFCARRRLLRVSVALHAGCFSCGARPRTWLLDGDDTVVPNGFHADWRSLARRCEARADSLEASSVPLLGSAGTTRRGTDEWKA